ncbi:MAG: glycoside hydrolase family 30 protein [Chloroflexota bacterium]
MIKKLCLFTLSVAFSGLIAAQNAGQAGIEAWVTKRDRSMLFEKSPEQIPFSDRGRGFPIVIDESHAMQTIDGFGFALTGGSAELMMKMTADARKKLIKDLFSSKEGVGVSYLRMTIGSSDLNSFVYSYDDLKEGETDFELEKFNLGPDRKDVIPVLKEILAESPEVKILASPWSAPVWMKTNGKVKAGSLKPECFAVYAQYLVRYIQEMAKEGIKIDAITLQNEPLNANNTPSMRMSAADQGEIIRNHLGPALAKAGLKTKIILFDHNLDRPDYPLSILNDPAASQFVDGSGFHHYGGDMSAMSTVHTAFPDKNLYFTEQMVVERPGSTTIDISGQVKRLIIGATQNWSRNMILWNIAADPLNDPHTDDGGCSMCQGAVTLDGDKIGKNIGYYVVAHASKFVTPGSVRIASTQAGDMSVELTTDEERREIVRVAEITNNEVLPNVAFRRPDGRIVLIVANDSGTTSSFTIRHKSRSAVIRLDPGSVGTYIW